MPGREPEQRDHWYGCRLRVAPGTRVYGEWLVTICTRAAGQRRTSTGSSIAGGRGMVRGTRVSWGGEYTRPRSSSTTSYFGRDLRGAGQPLDSDRADAATERRLDA